jgi:hypothetical protein
MPPEWAVVQFAFHPPPVDNPVVFAGKVVNDVGFPAQVKGKLVSHFPFASNVIAA